MVSANPVSFQRRRYFKSSSNSDWYQAIAHTVLHAAVSVPTHMHMLMCMYLRTYDVFL